MIADGLKHAIAIDTVMGQSRVEWGPLIGDMDFLRRSSLALQGRNPTISEIKKFKAFPEQQARELWVDHVLDSDGYVSHQYNLWCDLLRIKQIANLPRLRRSHSNYQNFIRSAIEEKKSYPDVVEALLSAQGHLFEAGNGAVGYYLRDRDMPLDHMSTSVRLFLGTRLECAQCHNDPFTDKTQKDFFSMAAFVNGPFRFFKRFGSGKDTTSLRSLRKDFLNKYGEKSTVAFFDTLMRVMNTEVVDGGRGTILLPSTYAYDDAKPYDLVHAKTLFGERLQLDPVPLSKQGHVDRQKKKKKEFVLPAYADINSKAVYANWVVSPSNRLFTKVWVNRVFFQIMGWAPRVPYDNIKADSKADFPELENALVKIAKAVDYDARSLEKAIVLSRAFASQAYVDGRSKETLRSSAYHFRRRSAEQIYDSMMSLILGPKVDQSFLNVDMGTLMFEESQAAIQKFGLTEGVNKVLAYLMQQPDKIAFRLYEMKAMVLKSQLFNGSERSRWLDQLDRAFKDESFNGKKLRRLERALNKASRFMLQPQLFHARMSELRSRPDVFKPFGLSDRETIDAEHRSANVPQVLTLMNSTRLVDKVIRGSSVFAKALNAIPTSDLDKKVDLYYESFFCRSPDPLERSALKAILSRKGKEVNREAVWMLLNSHEFKFLF